MTAADEQQRILALNALATMRSTGASLRSAARSAGTTAKDVIRLAGSALRKSDGRYRATERDSLLRVLTIPSARGPREVVTRNSHTASQLASYAASVQKYLRTGDSSALKPFRKLRVLDASGRRIALTTNLAALTRVGHAGLLSFESLYRRVAR
jgi:N-acetylglucosamine kinase-like BadF-type ATPase